MDDESLSGANLLLRYEIAICGFDGERTPYAVSSRFGIHKAVAMAVNAHLARPHPHGMYRVEARELPERSLGATDLVDRMEW